MTDSLVHYHLYEYKARAAIAETTEIVREAQQRHGLDPLTTIAVGRAISCAALLASVLKKSREYFHCSFTGEGGLLHKIVGECNGEGHCRGYASPARLADVMQPGQTVPLSVGDALGGAGRLSVTRGDPREDGSPYNAVIALFNGEIATDIAKYLTDSEQIPSAVAAGVKLDHSGRVLSAGGVLVQKLAGTDLSDQVLKDLEFKMAKELHLTDRMAKGETHEQIIQFLQGGKDGFGLLTSREIKFQCSCSRHKMADAFAALGEKELREIEKEIGLLEMRCHYCSTKQEFQLAELIKH